MTELGIYLAKRSINKAEVSRKTGLSAYRISQLTINSKSQLRVEELYLIALAIGVKPGEMFEYLCRDLTLQEDNAV